MGELTLFPEAASMRKSAAFSDDRRFRYELRRVWDPAGRLVAFIGLNPSKADENDDDPTIRRCVGFARSWGYGGLVMVNAYSFCATDPRELKAAGYPVGGFGNVVLEQAARVAGLLVACWGANCEPERQAALRKALPGLHHLGLTKDGFPRHPLRLAGETRPVLWELP